MATWTLTASSLPSVEDANLTPNITLDDNRPGDFDENAITEIRLYRTFTLSGPLANDEWVDHADIELYNGSSQLVLSHIGADQDRHPNTGSWESGTTSTSAPTNKPSATGNYLAPIASRWATYNKNQGPDGVTASISSIRVEIDYTPLSGPTLPAARVRNATDTAWLDGTVWVRNATNTAWLPGTLTTY